MFIRVREKKEDVNRFLCFLIMQLVAAAVFFLLLLEGASGLHSSNTSTSAVAMMVFGDSLVDQGNNNYLFSIARCDYTPYGIDFPGGATGRFCNGRLISDFLSELMGTAPIVAWLSPQMGGANLLRGANFASAGCGILEETGSLFITRLTIPEQIQMFGQYKEALVKLIGDDSASKLIRNAIYNINVGSNDWVNNYAFYNASIIKRRYGVPIQYNNLLINTYKDHLKALYSMGARKIVVTGMGPIGCAPSVLNRFNSVDGKCVELLQSHAKQFNSNLKVMLDHLRKELPSSIIIYANGFDMLMDYVNNPSQHGFEVVNEGCCGQGKYKGYLTCVQLSSYCEDRSKYLFWDAFHPTEAVNSLLAKRVFKGPTSDMDPTNLQQLINTQL